MERMGGEIGLGGWGMGLCKGVGGWGSELVFGEFEGVEMWGK